MSRTRRAVLLLGGMAAAQLAQVAQTRTSQAAPAQTLQAAQTDARRAAPAETLRDALAAAYRGNPMLRAAQANQRATDETEVQARAGWRPTVSVTATSNYVREPADIVTYQAGTIETNYNDAALDVRQPLYTGGRVSNAVRGAEARVRAGRQGLRVTEAQTFQTVIVAYMDVLRDQRILGIRSADLDVLARQVKETGLRFKLGAAATRTDVAQAEAQRQQAVAARAAAEAQLAASRASFRAAVGTPPGTLEQPGTFAFCPASLEEALRLADAANPGVAQGALLADASKADVGVARSAAFPTVGLEGVVGAIGPAAPLHTHAYERDITVTLTVTQPLIAGGMIDSQIRQAKDRDEAAKAGLEQAARQALQMVTTSWSQLSSGKLQIQAGEAQVEAAALALRGYQAEYRYGLRTTLDLLIADQDLRAAQISLEQSRHDTIVAEAALLAAVGRLEVGFLLPATPPYNPQEEYRRVKLDGSVPWEGAIRALDHGG